MKCDKAEKLLMDSLMGVLERDEQRELEKHLAGCEQCRQEAAGMESLWQALGDMDEEREAVPSDRLTRRFRLALADFEAELENSSRPGLSEWWGGLWAARPAWQAAFSAAVLIFGVLLGAGISTQRSSSSEIAELRDELENMSQAVTLSLLQHQSASERLRAVSWSRMAGPDDRVLGALLDAARLDPNVNVRLAAVDALAIYADQAPVRSSLIDSLSVERSPLVQLAVLEAVAGDEGLRNGELERVLGSSDVDESVLQYFTAQAERL